MGAQRGQPPRVRAGQVGTARIIAAAAAIMMCVFLAFSLMSQRGIAEFGISLTIAVALARSSCGPSWCPP